MLRNESLIRSSQDKVNEMSRMLRSHRHYRWKQRLNNGFRRHQPSEFCFTLNWLTKLKFVRILHQQKIHQRPFRTSKYIRCIVGHLYSGSNRSKQYEEQNASWTLELQNLTSNLQRKKKSPRTQKNNIPRGLRSRKRLFCRLQPKVTKFVRLAEDRNSTRIASPTKVKESIPEYEVDTAEHKELKLDLGYKLQKQSTK